MLYHILNRGVDKRKVFLDKQDYYRFVHDLFEFNDQQRVVNNIGYRFDREYKKSNLWTSDVHRLKKGEEKQRRKRKLLVRVHAFCLMPNHYHLLLSPLVKDGIPLFMKKLGGGYAKYFNEKNERTGALWQGKYKSVHINTEPHFLYIPFYIHLNPLDLKFPEWRDGTLQNKKDARAFLNEYRWSSHLDYLGKNNLPSVTQREFLTGVFDQNGGYSNALTEMLGGFDTEAVSDLALE